MLFLLPKQEIFHNILEKIISKTNMSSSLLLQNKAQLFCMYVGLLVLWTLNSPGLSLAAPCYAVSALEISSTLIPPSFSLSILLLAFLCQPNLSLPYQMSEAPSHSNLTQTLSQAERSHSVLMLSQHLLRC